MGSVLSDKIAAADSAVDQATNSVVTDIAPIRAAHGSIQDALRSLETGTANAGRELAKKLQDELPEHPKGGTDAG